MIWKPIVFKHQTRKATVVPIFHFDTSVFFKIKIINCIIVYYVTDMVERTMNLQMETWYQFLTLNTM